MFPVNILGPKNSLSALLQIRELFSVTCTVKYITVEHYLLISSHRGSITQSGAVLQNKPVMVFGLVTITLCVGYLGYLHAVKENDQQLYEAIDSEGERYMRRKTSKWD